MRYKVIFGHPKWLPAAIFLKTFTKKSCASDLKKGLEPTKTLYTFTFGQYILYTYRQLCWERGNIHCVRHIGRMHTILVV